MNTFGLYQDFRKDLGFLSSRVAQYEPQFRDGTGLAVWLTQASRQLDMYRVRLTASWFLSDATHTLVYADFHVGQGPIDVNGWLGGTPAEREAAMTERDRTKMEAFFKADKTDLSLNVQAKLGALSSAIAAAKTEALSLINITGDVITQKFVDDGGVIEEVSKTISEMGINAVPLADLLLAVDVAAKDLIDLV